MHSVDLPQLLVCVYAMTIYMQLLRYTALIVLAFPLQ